MTNCNHKQRTNVDKSNRHVQVRPHCFIFTKACSCRLELAYFAGRISKDRLVCKNTVALAYYGSCRLLVMGSCMYQFFAVTWYPVEHTSYFLAKWVLTSAIYFLLKNSLINERRLDIVGCHCQVNVSVSFSIRNISAVMQMVA